jgi:hypothetical protein
VTPRFSLDDYETVESRITRFYKDHPKGRIVTWVEWHDPDMSKLVFGAKVYKPDEDAPWATGFAFEVLGSSPVNKTSHVENAETSAIGRALANAGYATKGKRPSREEMEKAQRAGIERVPDPGIPTAPLVTEESAERIRELGRRLTKRIGREAAEKAYTNARDAVVAEGSTLLEEHAVRIITSLELALSLAQKDSAGSIPPSGPADGAAVEQTAGGAGSGGPHTPNPPAAPITKKQRENLQRRREELFHFTGSDEAWFGIMAEVGAKTLDDLDGIQARQVEHLVNEQIRKTDFVPPQSVQTKLGQVS